MCPSEVGANASLRAVSRRRRSGARALAWVLVILGCGADEPRRAASPIVGGVAWEHPPVVRLGGIGSCTGALLAPNLVLTAKHCVTRLVAGGSYDCDERGELVRDPRDAGVVFVDAGRFGAVAPARELFVNPHGFTPRVVQVLVSAGDTMCASDVALLVLEGSLDDPEIAPVRLDAPPVVGEALVSTGFGQTDDAAASSILLRRDVTLVAVGPVALRPDADAVQVGFFTTTEGVCRGDSGSPALSPEGAVVGVASAISNPTVRTPTGTASDCRGAVAKYQSLTAVRDLVLAGYAAAGAMPWYADTPDPRAGLAPFGAPCDRDAVCRSNACVPDPRGASRCSRGCAERACPTDYRCADLGARRRCVYARQEPPARRAPPPASGCGVSLPAARGSWRALLPVLVALAGCLSRRRHPEQPAVFLGSALRKSGR